MPNSELGLACSNLPKREYNQGTTVNDISNESIVAIATVIQNSRTIFTTIELPIEIGTNTITITKVIAITVSTISFEPSKAARTLFLPISIWRCIFSKTTIASSTKIPTTNERATKLIRLRVKPKKYIPIKAAISEVGIDTITIRALRKLCKKKNITTATKTIAKTKSNITELAACRVNSLVSSANNIFTPSFL